MIGKKYVKTTMVTLEAIAVFLSIFSTFSTAGMYTVSNTQKPFSKLFIEYMTFTVKYMNFIKKKPVKCILSTCSVLGVGNTKKRTSYGGSGGKEPI